jgi:peptidoglycan hydrolase CwlO-like protein
MAEHFDLVWYLLVGCFSLIGILLTTLAARELKSANANTTAIANRLDKHEEYTNKKFEIIDDRIDKVDEKIDGVAKDFSKLKGEHDMAIKLGEHD